MPSVAGLPSVTEVLKSCGLVETYDFLPAKHRTAAQDRGKALHRAIELWHEGTLDEASLHPLIRPGFEAYRGFCDDTGCSPLFSELELIDKDMGVVGHLDYVGKMKGRLALIDFKYSDAPDIKGATLQVSGGYASLWQHVYPEQPIEEYLVLQLGRSGRYKVHNVADPHALMVFRAAVIVYRAKHAL